MLTLYEELTILLLDPNTNTFPRSKPSAHYILAASILVELSMKKKIRRNDEGMITLLDSVPTGDELLDNALQRIKEAKEPRSFRQWIQQLTYHIGSLNMAVSSLEKHHIIRREREWWFIFPRTRWYFNNPGIQHSVKFRIALTDDASRNERIAGLISLVMAGESALKHLFRQEEWDDLRIRFKQFIASNPIPSAVKEMMYNSGSGDELTLILLMSAMGSMDGPSADDGGAGDGGVSGGDGGGGDGGGGSD